MPLPFSSRLGSEGRSPPELCAPSEPKSLLELVDKIQVHKVKRISQSKSNIV